MSRLGGVTRIAGGFDGEEGMRIIIVGAGKVGFTVASQLVREEHSITVIENNEDVLQDVLSAIDVGSVLGSGINRSALAEAGASEADLLIALTGDDEQNLLCCLAAKKLGTKNTVARVRRPEYTDILPLIRDDLGLSMSVNPERAAAMEIARILELPLAKKVETFAQGKVEMIDYDVDADSPMCGKLVRQACAGCVCAHALGAGLRGGARQQRVYSAWRFSL